MASSERKVRTGSLMFWMFLAIVAVAGVAYWDEQREFAAALRDFAGEQTSLAEAVAATLRAPLQASASSAGSSNSAQQDQLSSVLKAAAVSSAVRSVERPRLVRFFIRGPSSLGLMGSDGQVVRSPVIESALLAGTPWVRLSRSEAGSLGLPARTAMAGLATLSVGGTGNFGIAVVASARRERDRELFAQWRLFLSVFVAAGLVLAFGGLALRNQRKQMALTHQLAVASAQSERDERLVRADKLATMGALATGIAHEVSTPLGVIAGRAEQLRSKLNGDERSKRAVDAIAEQAERISAIIRGFLALARGDSPRMDRVEPTALGKVAFHLVEHRFAKARVHLTSAFAGDLPEIACEPRLMEQVLVNLLLNACDACDEGGHVELKVIAEGQRVAYVVTDDGSGISADASARVMEPFFTTKPAGEGSGLGLAIANELVKHHRGTLSVAARQGHPGTRACVELPVATELHHA